MLIESGPFKGLVRKGYKAILIDPSWAYATRSPKGDGRSASRYYKTMKLPELKALPVWDLADTHCIMIMWVIDTHIPQALDLINTWEFKFKTVGFYWTKTNKDGGDFMGMGFWSRANPEQTWISAYEPLDDDSDPLIDALEVPHQAFLASRGSPKRLSKNVRRLIQAPRREHSRKPDELYASIEALVDGPYIELFSRKSRPGWTAWGNEAGKFDVNNKLAGLLDDSPTPRRSMEDLLS